MDKKLRRFIALADARAKIESACLHAMPLVFKRNEYESICEEGFFEIVKRTASEIEIATHTAYLNAGRPKKRRGI